jgi:hypothetical protein
MGRFQFSTLEMLCDLLKLHPEKVKLRDTLYSIYIDLSADLGKINPWGHVLFDTRGGYIGLLSECLVDMSDDAYLIKLIDELLEKKDIHRFEILAEQILYSEDKPKVIEYLVEKSKSLEKKYREIVEHNRASSAKTKAERLKRQQDAKK